MWRGRPRPRGHEVLPARESGVSTKPVSSLPNAEDHAGEGVRARQVLTPHVTSVVTG